jgi:hypothetical protein
MTFYESVVKTLVLEGSLKLEKLIIALVPKPIERFEYPRLAQCVTRLGGSMRLEDPFDKGTYSSSSLIKIVDVTKLGN